MITMPVSTTYIRARRLEENDDSGSKVKYPISNAAHLILVNCYRDQYVIPHAVIELLRDYNPFSSRTGLTKKQVTKYVRILLDEQPELADNIVTGLPNARDLLPPELLARIPPPGNPDPVDIPTFNTPSSSQTSVTSIKSQMCPTSQSTSKRSLSKSASKRRQPSPQMTHPAKICRQLSSPLPEDISKAHKREPASRIDRAPKIFRQLSAPLPERASKAPTRPDNVKILFPLKPTLFARPDILSISRASTEYNPSPPPLTPGYKTFTRFPSSPAISKCPKVSLLRKATSAESLPMLTDWSLTDGDGNPSANPSELLDMISQEEPLAPASQETLSTVFSEDVDVRPTASISPTKQSVGITQSNFKQLLPALASAIEDVTDDRSAVSAKDYDPLLGAASDKVLRVKPMNKVPAGSVAMQQMPERAPAVYDNLQLPSDNQLLPTDSHLLPDNLLVSYLNRSWSTSDEQQRKHRMRSELVIPSTYSRRPSNLPSNSSLSPTITYQSAGSAPTDLMTCILSPTRGMPIFPLQDGSIPLTPAKAVKQSALPVMSSLQASGFSNPAGVGVSRNVSLFLRQEVTQGDSDNLFHSDEERCMLSPTSFNRPASDQSKVSSNEWSPLSR